MSYPNFPASLRRCPVLGWRESPLSNVITFETEVGAQKRRRRSTNSGYEYVFELRLTHPQLQTFWNFYQNDTKDGVLRFNMYHPRTRATAVMQFESPPEVRQLAPKLYIVSMTLRAFV